MATISNTPRPGYVWDSTDNVWYPIGTGPHTHADYITSGSAINPNIVDAKGDIIAATAADTVARLAVGSNDTVLTADSSTATGLKWATPAGASWSSIASGNFSGAGTTVTVTGVTGKILAIVYDQMSPTAGNGNFFLRFNSDTGSNYYVANRADDSAKTGILLATTDDGAAASYRGWAIVNLADSTAPFKIVDTGFYGDEGNSGYWVNSNAITSISLALSTGSYDAGTYQIWKLG